jgi:hypothetical protein
MPRLTAESTNAEHKRKVDALAAHLPLAQGLLVGMANWYLVSDPDPTTARREREMQAQCLDVAEECGEALELTFTEPPAGQPVAPDLAQANLEVLNAMELALRQAANIINNMFIRIELPDDRMTVPYLAILRQCDEAVRMRRFGHCPGLGEHISARRERKRIAALQNQAKATAT